MNRILKNKQKMMMEGVMTIGMTNDGLHTADFVSSEPVEIETLNSTCKVHIMRGGNIYMTELPKRIKNKPLFRQDHSSLSSGKNRKFYFVFVMDEELADEIPDTLTREAKEAARKFTKAFLEAGEER